MEQLPQKELLGRALGLIADAVDQDNRAARLSHRRASAYSEATRWH